MKRLVLLSLMLLTSFTLPAKELVFGIVPQQSAARLAEMWTPMINYISQQTGHQIRFATAKDIPTFERRVLAGEYDIVYMNPYHYTVFSQKPGYDAIAKQKNKQIKGLLVVPKSSAITELSQLQQARIAFPSPAAFAASVLPRAELRRQGVDFEPVYVSSHDSVYLNVSRGFFPAGGGIKRTFNAVDSAVSDNLRILWQTKGYTPHALAIHPKHHALKPVLNQALMALNKSDAAQSIYQSVGFKHGWELAQDSDWDDVRQLDIHLLDALLAATVK